MAKVNGWLHQHMGVVLGFAAIGVVSLAVVFSSPAVATSPNARCGAALAADDSAAVDSPRGRFNRPWMGAKYVFFFIGDGMASVQIHAAEAYLEADNHYVPGAPKAELLTMSRFPVQGMATTFADNRFITGSAAAGTALACGEKTSIGNISIAPDDVTPFTSVAELARDAGMRVGIVSSVSIDHATPAVFYAHQPSRSMYYEIGIDLANSDFDYFGGGGFINPNGGTPSVWDALNTNGYTYVQTLDELQAIQPGTKCIAINHTLAGSALYYEIDRPADHMALADFTAEGIRLLDNPNGFFMMVEGGKIDWACHANDARSSIDDTLAFDAAIAEAVAFYNQHPQETLIVVTGDHECGGQTIGFALTGYENAFELLDNQTMSYEAFSGVVWPDYEANHQGVQDIDDDFKAIMLNAFGLDWDADPAVDPAGLTDFQRARLEDAFDKSMSGQSQNLPEEDQLLYGSYEPITVTITHILNEKAGLAWTSYSHTGVPVPVLAIGRGAYLFDGFYDNTDVAKKIAQAMNVDLNN
jgi:alkaline phosphatase